MQRLSRPVNQIYNDGSYETCPALWFNSILKEIMIEVKEPMQIMVDSKSTNNLAKKNMFQMEEVNIYRNKIHFLRK